MTRVLEADTDREEWLEWWRRCGREPFAHPAYCRLLAGDAGRPVALILDGQPESALLPLVIRPLRDLPWADEELYDAISPYGYGGPFFPGTPGRGRRYAESVLAELADWVVRAGLCSVFLRLSLESDMAVGIRTPQTEVVDVSENVVVDLRRTPEELWANYEHKVRKNVKKAARAGCSVRREDRLNDVDGFLQVYGETMRRRGAAAYYHFDRTFFTTLSEELAGSYSVFSVLDDTGRVVSVELVLESDAHLYSFLGGTRAEAFPMAPNDLLKHEVVLYGRRTGRQGFVLGGGYERGDGIFRYKRAFDPGGVRTFRAVRMVGDPARYTSLVQNRARRAGSLPAGDSFFPAYREPVTATPVTAS
ncbi:GNAT family N-acetyltransferase [Planosporangium mesophilum]|uniref:GNAT family N-acetyltransferase n=1 Tax=Planosporangium mesophilum TaxID=689768 RepID=UPI00143B2384|nr:GNAT family N-acetyltransferase [Planosporangium mesophilum]NJC81139.1 GNAT family N-acetyltransferase [Planosporangium mesophilum]